MARLLHTEQAYRVCDVIWGVAECGTAIHTEGCLRKVLKFAHFDQGVVLSTQQKAMASTSFVAAFDRFWMGTCHYPRLGLRSLSHSCTKVRWEQ